MCTRALYKSYIAIISVISYVKQYCVILGMGKTGRGAGVGVGDQWVKPGTETGRSRDAYVSPDDASACRGAHVMTGLLCKALVVPYLFENC